MSIKKYHIGTTQWGLDEWVGNFYSDDAKPDRYLSQYASVFSAVEGNTSFYRVPSTDTLNKWADMVPDGFKFCFKFPKSITHDKMLLNVDDEVLRFIDQFDSIREKTGPFHLQLGPRFSFDEFDRLENVLNLLPAGHAYAVEVRHADYFDKGKKENHLNHLLKSLNIDRVIFDTRKLFSLKPTDPSIIQAQQRKPNTPVRFDTTGSRPFVRYVGANDVLNNEAHLKEWVIIIADWIREGLHPYMFIHAPDKKSAPALARFFHRELSKLIEISPMPKWPVDRQDEQLGLF